MLRDPAKVLILDEPTSSLDDAAVQQLFAVLRRLRDQGLAILRHPLLTRPTPFRPHHRDAQWRDRGRVLAMTWPPGLVNKMVGAADLAAEKAPGHHRHCRRCPGAAG